MPNDRLKSRQASYKKGVDAVAARARRQDTTINIRKQKRQEGLAKRRNTAINNFVGGGSEADTSSTAPVAGAQGGALTGDVANIPALVAAINATDVRMQTEGARAFRKMLSVEHNPPVQAVIDSGVLPRLVSFLRADADSTTQFECAWALTNIASTEHTKVVVDCGAVPGLVLCLMSPNADVREQCAWCLGNVAGDSPELRDVLLATPNSVRNLLANVTQPASPSMLRNATWALSNFCRGKPQPALEMVQPCIPVLAAIVKQVPDKEVLMDAGWALSYLSDGNDERIGAVVDAGTVPTLINLLRHDSASVITPALRTLGNIVSGSDRHTQAVVDAGGLSALLPLLKHNKKAIRKECCWALSNIAAGTQAQIGALVSAVDGDGTLLLKGVVHQLEHGEWDVKKEAAWVISNIATGGKREHVRACVSAGAIKPVCELLTVDDARVVTVALDAIESFFKSCVGKDGSHDEMARLIDEADGLDKIEELQQHANVDVYEKAVHLIETYFGAEDDEENDQTQPQTCAEGGGFAFGTSQAAPVGGFNFGNATGGFNFQQ